MFIKGADISSYIQMKEEGKKLYNKKREEESIFTVLKQNGFNFIRLRLWNEPECVPETKGYCNLEDTVKIAKEANEQGFGVFLDFHYSDWWADPAKQIKPRAWKELSGEALCHAVYEFTKQVLERLKKENVVPQLVQIGNEIRSGMLFPDGAVPNWKTLANLIQAGIRGVRDSVSREETSIVIHLDQGGRFFYLKEWFDQILLEGVTDFDIIAISYYPFWHGTFYELRETMEKLKERYNRPILIAETAHAWKRSEKGFIGEEQEKIAGFPATLQAQKTVLELILNITVSVGGLGVFYWEPFLFPEGESGSWGENMGLIDEQGIVLEGASAFLYEPNTIDADKIVKLYEPKPCIVLEGTSIPYPDKIKVLTWDGRLKNKAVVWNKLSQKEAESYIVTGNLEQDQSPVQMKVQIVTQLDDTFQYISNGEFQDGLEGWNIQKRKGNIEFDIQPEFNQPFPAPPDYYFFFESKENFAFSLIKDVILETEGKYQLSVCYRGTNTTGVEVKLFLYSEYEKYEKIIYPSDEEWQNIQLQEILLQKGKIQVGLIVDSPPVFGKVTKFCLEKK